MMPHRLHSEPLPPFVAAGEIRRAFADALRPPARVSVSDAAERHRRLANRGAYSGPWRNAMTPYLVEPMDALISRLVEMVVLVGPSQFGKTEVFLNFVVHAVKYRPGDILAIQPTQALAIDFAERRVEKGMIESSPDIARELGPSRGDDKTLTKCFRNGTTLAMGWPTGGQLASRPVPSAFIDERDRIADDIDGEGDPVDLIKKRITTFGRNGVVGVGSSPSREDYSGIVVLYDQGDRRLWHVVCPHCAVYFTPGFDEDRRPTLAHLRYPDGATPEIARADSWLECPECEGRIEERHKAAMNATGTWLPEGQRIAATGAIEGPTPIGRVRSYWFSGLMNPFRSFGQIAEELLRAAKHQETTGDEEPLKSFWNTTLGAPYRRKSAGAEALDADMLKARAEDIPLGVVPVEAAFVTAAVDVQGTRFECMAVAWGHGGRSWLVDVWTIFKATDASGAERPVDPAHNAADWDLLVGEVLERSWPVVGDAARRVRAVLVGVDTGGADGVSGQAYDWWFRQARAHGARIMLLKGGNRKDAPLVSTSTIESDPRGRRLKIGIRLTTVNVHAVKSMADTRLRKTEIGPLYVHLSKHLPDRVFEELTAEQRTSKGWEKVKPRNEAWDLFVYNLAAFARANGLRIDWSNPPPWARLPSSPAAPIAAATVQPTATHPATPIASQSAPRRGRLRGYMEAS